MAARKDETVPEAMGEGSGGGWRPEPGDSVTGKLVDVTTGGMSSEFGRYPIVSLEHKDGTFTHVHAFHHTLKTRLTEMRPKIGHELTITYVGEEEQTDFEGNLKIRDGEPMTLKLYTVESPQFEYNWDQF